MDYKIMYEQAIKRAKAMISVAANQEEVYNGVITIFPELKEREDERVRKDLIRFIKGCFPDETSEQRKTYLAWLEKQDEKPQGKSALEAVKEEKVDNQNCVKPVDRVEPLFMVGDTMRTLEEAKHNWTDGMPVVVSIDEEHYHCTNELIAIKDQDDYEYPPMNRRQKPAWSEEDENKPNGGIVMEDFNRGNGFYKINLAYLNEEQVKEIEELVKRWHLQPKEDKDESIISDLLDYFDEDKCLKHEVNDIVKWLKTIKPQQKGWSDNEIKMLDNLITYLDGRKDLLEEIKSTYISWLKDLKDRVQPQPKQEWSEEDERLFQIVIDILDRQNHLGNISHTDLIACVRKLKSLRPQTTWKPSDEQIKTLGKWLDDTRYKGDCRYV